MKGIVRFLALILCLLTSGCDLVDNSQAISHSQRKIAELEKRIEIIDEYLKEKESQLLLMNFRIADLALLTPKNAWLEPSNKNYSILVAQGGYFSVACDDIRAYSTGSEVRLKLVNLLSAPLSNIKLSIGYSPSADEYVEKSKQATGIVHQATPGTAEYITIRLPEYKPEEIRILNVSAEVGGMSWKGKKY